MIRESIETYYGTDFPGFLKGEIRFIFFEEFSETEICIRLNVKKRESIVFNQFARLMLLIAIIRKEE
jgi:hypothetical protein